MTFWNDLAKECQEEFKRFGTEGKCNRREINHCLPENTRSLIPTRKAWEFTEQFKKRYDVECLGAPPQQDEENYHIHLIFSERRLLPGAGGRSPPAACSMMNSASGQWTKKEIPGEDGQIVRAVSSSRKARPTKNTLFTAKDEVFKNELFLDEAKQFY